MTGSSCIPCQLHFPRHIPLHGESKALLRCQTLWNYCGNIQVRRACVLCGVYSWAASGKGRLCTLSPYPEHQNGNKVLCGKALDTLLLHGECPNRCLSYHSTWCVSVYYALRSAPSVSPASHVCEFENLCQLTDISAYNDGDFRGRAQVTLRNLGWLLYKTSTICLGANQNTFQISIPTSLCTPARLVTADRLVST